MEMSKETCYLWEGPKEYKVQNQEGCWSIQKRAGPTENEIGAKHIPVSLVTMHTGPGLRESNAEPLPPTKVVYLLMWLHPK